MMRAPISVIIPTLNAQTQLPHCMAALSEGLNAGLIRELVVSDGGSSDATLAVAEAAGAIGLQGVAGRGGQLRRGALAASGAWLLFLHADTELQPGWTEAVSVHIATPNAGAAYFKLGFRAVGFAPRVVARWANARARVFGLPYGDQGLLISAAAYDAAGGYPDQPLMEDVALVRRLRGLSALDAIAETGAERYLRDGWLRRGARNLWTLARYFAGTDPEVLARAYRK